MVSPSYEYDQLWASAVIVRYNGGGLQLLGLETFETSKSDNGQAGTFSLTASLATNTASSVGSIAPQDIIAIYASRSSAISGINDGVPGPSFVATSPYAAVNAVDGLKWGQISTINALNSNTLVMLGMIDQVTEESNPESASATLSISGRDLTKCLIDTDAAIFNVPTKQIQSFANQKNGSTPIEKAAYDGMALATSMSTIANFALTNEYSGTKLLLDMLDVFVARSADAIGQKLGTALTENDTSIVGEFGFPWRNFIRTDGLEPDGQTLRLDPNFKHCPPTMSNNGVGLNFQVTSGSAWANCLEMKNEPFTRLFVSEEGYLTFDDPLTAYTNVAQPASPFNASPKAFNPATVVIQKKEIRSFRTWLDDSDLITFLAIFGALQLGKEQLASLQGLAQAGASSDGFGYAAFVSGTGESVQAGGDGDVARYGARSRSLTSIFDTGSQQAGLTQLFKLIVLMHNDISFATITVKGRAQYRVGTRVNVLYGHFRPATQNATWYVTAVSHSYSQGSDWTTTLELRFGQTP